MSRRRKTPKATEKSNLLRPDPTFKDIIGQEAIKAGLELLNVEIQQLASLDLALAVPDKTKLPDTMFYFFNDVNLVEFKSENDDFNFWWIPTICR
jgi:hypothetical protein